MYLVVVFLSENPDLNTLPHVWVVGTIDTSCESTWVKS